MKKTQAGFTLIELLVSMTVLGILAVLASGAYISYVGKAQMIEGLAVAEGLQSAYKTYYQDNGKVPPTTLGELYGSGAGAIATDHMGVFVSSANLDGGSIVITYGIEANGDLTGSTLVLEPFETPVGALIWRCGTHSAPVNAAAATLLVAGSSAGSAISGTATPTTVNPELLPGSCR